MILQQFARELIIDVAKLTQYALNPHSDKGQHKAKVFKAALGYTQTNYQSLLEQIKSQALNTVAQVKRTDMYGQHLQVDIEVMGTTGQKAIVRTGWLIEVKSDTARLTTLYVQESVND